MILNNPLRFTRVGLFTATTVLLAPLIAQAADPAPAAKPPAAPAAVQAPPAATPAPAAPAPADSPVASSSPTPATPASATTASGAPSAVTVPAAKPPGWEGESAKDRLSASMYPHETEKIAIHLRGEEGDTFYAWLGGGRTTSNATTQIDGEVFEQLCEAPCTAQLPSGRNRIAVARGGSPVVANQDITLYAPTTLTADYSSYTAQRLLGALILVGGSVGGLALILTAPECEENPSDPNAPLKCDNTQEYIGIGVGVGGAIGGSLLLIKSDELEVSVAPGAGGATSRWPARSSKERVADALQGFQLNLRF